MTFRLETHGRIAHLLIDRAAKRGAITQAMWEALPGLIAQAVDDTRIRAIVLRAAEPGAFSAGAFGITPAKLGLVYSLHDTKLLVDLVGPAQAKRILFTGALIDAGEAYRIGLIDLLDGDATALAETIAGNAAHSVRQSKAMVRRILNGQAADDAETYALFADAFTLPDFDEGVAAFLAKRPAAFQ